MNDTRGAGADLPSWSWLWLPVGFVLLQHGFYLYDAPLYRRLFESELGFIELATPAIALVAMVSGIGVLRRRVRLPGAWLGIWFGLGALACFYFAGEELSWGQQLFRWQTPEAWNAVNDQHETNLHNTSSWLDQKPRLLLQIGILAGGIIYPLTWGRRRPPQPASWQYWLWPTMACLPTGVLALGIHLLDHSRVLHHAGEVLSYIRYSETTELYYAWFLLLYFASIRHRLDRLAAANARLSGRCGG